MTDLAVREGDSEAVGAGVSGRPVPEVPDVPARHARRYRGDIDGLRAISILAVVAYHADIGPFSGGYVGVDVFFVISGFLITGLLVREAAETGRISIRDFYARRIRRLLPLSTAVLTTTVILGGLLSVPLARPNLVNDAQGAALYVANWRFAGQATAYSDTNVEDGLFVHYWSLSVEEQFYFVWPFLVAAVAIIAVRHSRLSLRPTLGVALAVVSVLSFWASQSLTVTRGPAAYYLTHARLWEMGVGAVLALLVAHIPRVGRMASNVLAVGGLSAIVLAVLMFDAHTPFPGTAALVPVLGCAAVVVAGLDRPGSISRTLGSAPMRFVGRLSYAWYLWHWPVIGMAVLWGRRVGFDDSAAHNITIVAIAMSFGLAWLSHHLIENPARNLAWLRDNVGRNLLVGLALTCLPLVAGWVLLSAVETGDSAVQSEDGGGGAAMTPREAFADIGAAGRVCNEDPADPVQPTLCEVGDPDGAFGVVLIGDSHAQQWIPALAGIGETEGWSVRVTTRSGCTVFDTPIWSSALDRRYVECEVWRDEVRELLSDIESIDLLLLGRSALYDERVLGPRSEFLTGSSREAVWAESSAATFGDYEDLASEVMLLADTPWPGFSVPGCLSEQPSEPQRCEFDLTDSIRDEGFLRVAGPFAAQSGAPIVDVTALVCSAAACPVVTPDGVIKYRDSHHLTATYARNVAPELLASIRAASSNPNLESG